MNLNPNGTAGTKQATSFLI